MKRLIQKLNWTALLLLSTVGVEAATVTGDLHDNVFGAPLNTWVVFTPDSTPLGIGNSQYLDGSRKIRATNGVFTATNLVGGFYWLGFDPPASRKVLIFVPINSTNTYTLTQVSDINLIMGTGTTNVNQFIQIFTNALAVAAGTNVITVTNTGVVTVNVPLATNFSTLTISNLTYITNSTDGSINASAFGVKGDGIIITRCSMTAGSRTLVSSTANFTTNDVGKVLSIYLAGGTNLNLTTFITNVVNSTTVTLSNAAVTTVAQVSAVYGSDDTVPVQSALDAMALLGLNLFFNEGVYVINGPLRDLGTNSLHHNAQLYLPDVPPSPNGFVAKRLKISGPLTARGRGRGNFLTNDISSAGAVLFTTLVRGPDVNDARMLDCKNFTTATAGSPACNSEHYLIPYNNICVDVENMSFYSAFDNNITVLDLSALPNASVRNCLFLGGFSDSGCPEPTGTNGYAVKVASVFTENLNVFDENEIYCFYNGFGAAPSTWGGINWITTCYNGVNFWDSGVVDHSMGFMEIYECKNAIVNLRACENHVWGHVSIFNNVPGWWQPQKIIVDPNNSLTGELAIQVNQAELLYSNLDEVITGGNSLNIRIVGNIRNGQNQPNVWRGPMEYRAGGITSRGNSTLGIGADFGAYTITAGTQKIGTFGFPRWGDTNSDAADFMGIQGFSTNLSILDIGAGSSGKKGVNWIRLFTSADSGSAPVQRVQLDHGGTWQFLNVPNVYGSTAIWTNTQWSGALAITNQNASAPWFGTMLTLRRTDNAGDVQIRMTPDSDSTAGYLATTINNNSLDAGSMYMWIIANTINYIPFRAYTNASIMLKTNVVVEGQLRAGAIVATNSPSGSPMFGTSIGILQTGNTADSLFRLTTGPAQAVHFGMATENAGTVDNGRFYMRMFGPFTDYVPLTIRSNATMTLASNVFVENALRANSLVATNTIFFGKDSPFEPVGFLTTNGHFKTGPLYSSGNFIAGDDYNVISSSSFSSIGGGQSNLISSFPGYQTIAGGFNNTVSASQGSSILGGSWNTIISTGFTTNNQNAIVGGIMHQIVNNVLNSAILSGATNAIGSPAGPTYIISNSVVLGGSSNLISASYAATFGRRAQATNNGAVVFADGQDADFRSTTNDEFSIRAQGGFRVVGPITNNGVTSVSSGVASFRSNKSDTTAISVTASVFHWTNTQPVNVVVLIDSEGATSASLAINSGTTVFATKGSWTVPLQPGESFDMTYSGGLTPTARWKPW